ncbi:hypothetical protein ELI44_05230 [Rhizobium ruizarguesonis]|uniref:hypothetical protein n=1 Tax=Rhizobium ruizarguesonis TaxID=2081791 RepID=UPI0010318878|nr:hypothetical protein [Rhizobium ruizarguesonis]TAU47465.1 hypothetical protein ELI42_05205 [Rhizobium ruizarguesonis]TAU62535.1 hypothetical protein ELI44_05230 [Rhizobium ruizarguesonis]
MGFFSNFAIKSGRRNFTALVLTEVRLKLEQELGRELDLKSLTPSMVTVAEKIFNEDLAPHISGHPSNYKIKMQEAHQRAVDAICDAIADALDAFG